MPKYKDIRHFSKIISVFLLYDVTNRETMSKNILAVFFLIDTYEAFSIINKDIIKISFSEIKCVFF